LEASRFLIFLHLLASMNLLEINSAFSASRSRNDLHPLTKLDEADEISNALPKSPLAPR